MSANLIDLRRRILSVKNTQKITRAMKTVSAAKLRRSVTDLNKNKPFLAKVTSILNQLKAETDMNEIPLLEEREDGEILIVVITSDKGLCGGYNSNIIKYAESYYKKVIEAGQEASLIPVGMKAYQYFKKKNFPIKNHFISLLSKLRYSEVLKVSKYLQNIFIDEPVKKIIFISSQFLSASRQNNTDKQFFPLQPNNSETIDENRETEYILEPSPEKIYSELIPIYINSLIYQVMLEASASEHSARMVAMDMATRNADDMIKTLTLTLNKLRQALITKELLEIITATEALRK